MDEGLGAWQAAPRPILIGESPGPNCDPDMPLFPRPRAAAGGRLQEMMELTPQEYMDGFDRMNLLYVHPGGTRVRDYFPATLARVAAEAALPLLRSRTAFLLGRRVATAFGCHDLPFLRWDRLSSHDLELVVVPHPSGRNRWYNSARNRRRIQRFWRECKISLKLGSR